MRSLAQGEHSHHEGDIDIVRDCSNIQRIYDRRSSRICKESHNMPAKILVVDDEPDLELVIRQKFRRQIRARELHFAFAPNGVEALTMLRADPEIDLVLTDINMPNMDGLTLLEKLPTLNPVLKAVIITAYGDMRNIRTAMQRGAYDFLTKP